jgi:hypothetical protein
MFSKTKTTGASGPSCPIQFCKASKSTSIFDSGIHRAIRSAITSTPPSQGSQSLFLKVDLSFWMGQSFRLSAMDEIIDQFIDS